jgi:hypothetical protein
MSLPEKPYYLESYEFLYYGCVMNYIRALLVACIASIIVYGQRPSVRVPNRPEDPVFRVEYGDLVISLDKHSMPERRPISDLGNWIATTVHIATTHWPF